MVIVRAVGRVLDGAMDREIVRFGAEYRLTTNSRPALRDVDEDAWVLRGDHQQGACCSRRRPASLLLLLKRPHRDAEEFGKPRL